MSSSAKIYIAVVVACGAISTGFGVRYWEAQNPVLLIAVLILSVVGSFLKVKIPGISGTMSMNFIFMMLGITRLSLGEALAAGLTASLAQSLWNHKKQNNLTIVTFNLAQIAAAIGVSYATFHAAWFRGLPLPSIPRLWLVAGAYFLLNTGTVAGVISLTSGRNAWAIWKESYAWSYAHYWLGASAVAIFNIVEKTFGMEMALVVLPLAVVAYRTYCVRIESLDKSRRHAEEERRHAEEVAALHLRTIRALALAIEAKDSATAQHLHRVQTYALGIGRELELGAEEMQALSTASILHDIGKIAVPEYIISKPGKLSREEFEKMKIHPVVGAEIVDSVRFPYPVAPIVAAHHEKWDGSGYPYGLKGEDIPIGARILSAVDCLDALASDRQYRRALPVEKAMEFVVSESGKAFDPKIVEILSRRYQELEELARATLSADHLELSINAKIERGAAPDAGLEVGLSRSPGAQNFSLEMMADSLRELECLDALDRVLSCRKGSGDLLTGVLSLLRATLPFDSAAVFALDGERLLPKFTWGRDSPALGTLRVPVGRGLAGWVAENRIPLLNGNPATEAGWPGGPPPGFAARSALAVPLENEKGVCGVLALYSEQRDAFQGGHLRVCASLRARLAYALECAFVVDAQRSDIGRYPGGDLPNTGALLEHLDARIGLAKGQSSPSLLALRFAVAPTPAVLSCLRDFVDRVGRGSGFLARIAEKELIAVLPESIRGRSVVESSLASALLGSGLVEPVSVGWAQSDEDTDGAERLISLAASRVRPLALEGRAFPDALYALSVATTIETSSQPAAFPVQP
jgi:putative nucleotidyltransferase with HDIG domain